MKKIIGPVIFIIVALVIGYVQLRKSGPVVKEEAPSDVAVDAFVGGEKLNFINNPEIMRILKEKYGVTLNAAKAGSIEMVRDLPFTNKDALWPSNQIAVEIFKNRGVSLAADENIFNSPVVLYAYDIVTEALIKQGIVEKQSDSYYVVDFPKLIRLIRGETKWSDIGLSQLYGKVAIHSTDPTRSNSGNMFAGLMANVMNNAEVVTAQTLDNVLPDLKAYFDLRGYMEHSSGDLFKNFITTGVGAKPIIVGYENQLVEFAIENEKFIGFLRDKIRTLYPVPTVWSSHPVIALNAEGKRLIEALKDDEIQKIAWERHGFRSGLLGVENDPAILKVTGIPKEITAVMPMPDAGVMARIIETLGGASAATP